MISSDLKKIKKLTDNYNWKIVLISIDPTNDTPAKLKSYLSKHKMKETDFEFIVAKRPLVKKLSEILNIGFSDALDGNHIDHSSIMAVYDKEFNPIADKC